MRLILLKNFRNLQMKSRLRYSFGVSTMLGNLFSVFFIYNLMVLNILKSNKSIFLAAPVLLKKASQKPEHILASKYPVVHLFKCFLKK